jgi:hypothetical protein
VKRGELYLVRKLSPGSLSGSGIRELDQALAAALGLTDSVAAQDGGTAEKRPAKTAPSGHGSVSGLTTKRRFRAATAGSGFRDFSAPSISLRY